MAGEEWRQCDKAPKPQQRAFNEAPARWPGKSYYGCGYGCGYGCAFNEAPARWPGKRLPYPSFTRRTPPFNEAPARWPGKRTGFVGQLAVEEEPSMRPRLGGRGRERRLASMATPDPTFNEAPARWPGKRT